MTDQGAQSLTSPNGAVENKRRPFRRQQILDAAMELFNERGFHDTAMSDIGEVVGISGPGIYRHFPNKQSILETALLQAGEDMLRRVTEVVEGGGLEPNAVLDVLIHNYIQAIIEVPALSYFVMAERHALSDEMRAWVNRHMRLHAEEWVHALLRVRPELTDLEARVMVTAVFGLTYILDRRWANVDRDRLAALLRSAARAALMTERPEDSASPMAGSESDRA